MNTPMLVRYSLLATVFSHYACGKPYDPQRNGQNSSGYSSLSEVTSIDQSTATVDAPLPPDFPDYSDYPDPSNLSDLPDPPKSLGATTKKEDADESISPPNQIMGSNLRCYIEGTRKEVELEMGCRFQDKDDARVAVNKIAKKVVFSNPVVLTAGVSRAIKPMVDDSRYDVIFKFSGASFKDLKAAALSAYFMVNLYDLKNGESQDTIIADGSQLLISPPNSWWQREKVSDDNKDGRCQADEICRYKGNNLLWTRDSGEDFQYFEGKALCENLDDGNQGWRLPFIDELQLAFAKHIDILDSGHTLDLRPSHYWSGKSESDDYATFNLFSGESLYLATSESANVICVKAIE